MLRLILHRWVFTCTGSLLALAFIQWATGLYRPWLAVTGVLIASLLICVLQEWLLARQRRGHG